jgi:hypothetical protein
MKVLLLASFAVVCLVLAAPQEKAGKTDDGWGDWDTIVSSIEITGPEIMKAAGPGSEIETRFDDYLISNFCVADPFLNVAPLIAGLGNGKGVGKLVGEIINSISIPAFPWVHNN